MAPTCRRCTAVVLLLALTSLACHKTQTIRPPIDPAEVAAMGAENDVQIVRRDGQVIQLHSPSSWRVDDELLLGFRQPSDSTAAPDVVVPLADISSIELRSDDGISAAEGMVLGVTAAGLILLFAFAISFAGSAD